MLTLYTLEQKPSAVIQKMRQWDKILIMRNGAGKLFSMGKGLIFACRVIDAPLHSMIFTKDNQIKINSSRKDYVI